MKTGMPLGKVVNILFWFFVPFCAATPSPHKKVRRTNNCVGISHLYAWLVKSGMHRGTKTKQRLLRIGMDNHGR
jgi:hypothetical protein